MLKNFVLELHGEWFEFVDECVALFTSTHNEDPPSRDLIATSGIRLSSLPIS
jgi:hypothetical protein